MTVIVKEKEAIRLEVGRTWKELEEGHWVGAGGIKGKEENDRMILKYLNLYVLLLVNWPITGTLSSTSS